VVQGRCLSASGGRNANLTFINCDDDSSYLLWTKRGDGSYESAAYPGLCPRMGSGARCKREFSVLGECPGIIMASAKNYKQETKMLLKMEEDQNVATARGPGLHECLGTWTATVRDSCSKCKFDDCRYCGRNAIGNRPIDEYRDNVMTHTCSGVYTGQAWERLTSASA